MNPSGAAPAAATRRRQWRSLLVTLGIAASVIGAGLFYAHRQPGGISAFLGRQATAPLAAGDWYTGEIPAPRGRILDQYGRPLAWSTRTFSLNWICPADPTVAAEELAILRNYFPQLQAVGTVAGQCAQVGANLTPAELELANRLAPNMPSLRLESATRRLHVALPTIAALVGEVALVDGREVGVSGFEKEFDVGLRGEPGLFRVRLDTKGRWLKDSWQKVREMSQGHDVNVRAPVPPPAAAPVAPVAPVAPATP